MVRAIKDPKPSCSSRKSLKKPLQPLLKMFPADGHGDPIAWAVVYRALAGFYLGLIRALVLTKSSQRLHNRDSEGSKGLCRC